MRERKPISKEDREILDWAGQLIQDRLDGREKEIRDEDWMTPEMLAEKKKKGQQDEPEAPTEIKQDDTVPNNKQFGRHQK